MSLKGSTAPVLALAAMVDFAMRGLAMNLAPLHPHLSPQTIAELVIATSFAAGLNVYATVLALGAMTRLHWAVLPPGLQMLGSTWVLVAAAVLLAAEFVADKIPGFDLVWNAAHTFVRVPLAALLAYRATMQLSPEMQALITILGGAIALAAHGSKTSLRALVTPSPEPISNIALSTTEDVAAVGLTWIATHHPLAGASIVAVFLLALLLAARWMVRALKRLFLPRSPSAQSPMPGNPSA